LHSGNEIQIFLNESLDVYVKEGKPQWDLLGMPGIENLPAVQWRLQNIRRMAPMKHREALRKLQDYLGV
jgi:hypothetical protein